jgi:effector-binding domain-containing protein
MEERIVILKRKGKIMNRTQKLSAYLLGICLLVTVTAGLWAKPVAKEADVTIEKTDQQVLLYRIFRGKYDKAGQAIGQLFALAGQKGITPCGPVSFAYLNNPTRVSSEHWLTEIRIPVNKESLSLAGTLGEMTDIKTLPATEVVVAVKPEGMVDPGPLYEKLFTWIYSRGYMGVDNHSETFLSNATNGDYAQLKSRIIIPVEKISRFEP